MISCVICERCHEMDIEASCTATLQSIVMTMVYRVSCRSQSREVLFKFVKRLQSHNGGRTSALPPPVLTVPRQEFHAAIVWINCLVT